MKYLSLLLLAFLVCITVQQDGKKLIYVQELFRHGARYPIYPNDKDFSNISIIDNAVGQLTRQGKSQHYLLGKKLFEIYWDSLLGSNKTYRQEKFYFKSTDVNRTIQSLQSHLLGIFENTDILKITDSQIPFSYPAWNSTFTRSAGDLFQLTPYFHPLPIHVEKPFSTPWTQGDFLKTYDKLFCYKQNDWELANKRDSYILNITQNANFTKAITALSQVLGQTLSFYDVSKYYDNAQCLIYLGKDTLPIFVENNDVAHDLAKIYDISELIQLFYNEQQLRTTATGFFNQTVNQFKRVTKDQAGVQWAFYSAHDTTVLNMIVKLGLTSVNCIYQNYLNGTKNSDYCILNYPTYTTQLIFEVYQYPNKTSTFQIRYNGNYRKIPFCNYQLECDVEQLYSWYDSWKDENWVKNCGIKDSTSQAYFSIIIVELGIIIIFAVAAVLRYLDSKKPEVSEPPKQAAPAHQQEKKPQLQEQLLPQENYRV